MNNDQRITDAEIDALMAKIRQLIFDTFNSPSVPDATVSTMNASSLLNLKHMQPHRLAMHLAGSHAPAQNVDENVVNPFTQSLHAQDISYSTQSGYGLKVNTSKAERCL